MSNSRTAPPPGDPHWSVSGRTPTTQENRTGWMLFHHTGVLNLERLTAAQVDIRDIVHGLGHINRFNGQTNKPISVLWHSLMVHALCESAGPKTALEALFHDAGETYVGDWIKPLSGLFGTGLTDLRRHVQQRCFEAVGIPDATEAHSPSVRIADKLIVRYEIQAQFGYNRFCTWYTPLTDQEKTRVEDSLEESRNAWRRPGTDRTTNQELHRDRRQAGACRCADSTIHPGSIEGRPAGARLTLAEHRRTP